MEHGFNMNDEHPFPVAKTWKDVYNIVKGKSIKTDILKIQKTG